MQVITTFFSPTGPSSGNAYISKNYLEYTLGYGWFIYKLDLSCTNNRLILRGRIVYKYCFCVDFVVMDDRTFFFLIPCHLLILVVVQVIFCR